MNAQLHKITAAFTSAIVLMTSLYCACYGTSTAQAAASGDIPAQVPSHCHSHQAEKTPQKSDSPSPEKDHDPACQHCDQVTAAPEPATRFEAQPASHQWVAVFAPLIWTANLHSPAQPHCITDNLPPPRPASTLLGLHCALTI